MKISKGVLFLFGCLAVCPPAWSAGDPVGGERKAEECIACHGRGGYSEKEMVPKLAGQLDRYIVRAIIEFKSGIRINHDMSEKALNLPIEDLNDIAAYFSAQTLMKGTATGSALSKQGEKLFTRGRCNYCHGDEGKQYTPFLPVVPVIGGQRKDYLAKAIKDIRDGKRPADEYGMMQQTIKELSDIQIEALAEYVSGL
jgi:cytochrome c553